MISVARSSLGLLNPLLRRRSSLSPLSKSAHYLKYLNTFRSKFEGPKFCGLVVSETLHRRFMNGVHGSRSHFNFLMRDQNLSTRSRALFPKKKKTPTYVDERIKGGVHLRPVRGIVIFFPVVLFLFLAKRRHKNKSTKRVPSKNQRPEKK